MTQSEYYGSVLFTNYSHMMNDHTGRYCTSHAIAYLLVLVGALNWGLVGIGGYMGVNLNVVNLIFGAWAWLEWLIYLLVGLSAVFMMFQRSCGYCHGHDYEYSNDKNNSNNRNKTLS